METPAGGGSSWAESSPDLALDPATTAYWDGVHPTTAVHQIFAEQAFNSIPEPSMGILVVVAAGLLAGRRRR